MWKKLDIQNVKKATRTDEIIVENYNVFRNPVIVNVSNFCLYKWTDYHLSIFESNVRLFSLVASCSVITQLFLGLMWYLYRKGAIYKMFVVLKIG